MEMKQRRKRKGFRVWEQILWWKTAKAQKVEMEWSDVQFHAKAAGTVRPSDLVHLEVLISKYLFNVRANDFFLCVWLRWYRERELRAAQDLSDFILSKVHFSAVLSSHYKMMLFLMSFHLSIHKLYYLLVNFPSLFFFVSPFWMGSKGKYKVAPFTWNQTMFLF